MKNFNPNMIIVNKVVMDEPNDISSDFFLLKRIFGDSQNNSMMVHNDNQFHLVH
jgi:hypothetical protein